MQIRSATESDIPTLISFIKKLAVYEKLLDEVRVTPQGLQETLFCEHPKAFAVLAVKQDVPVAFAIYFFNYSTFLGSHGLYIEDIYVDEEVRGEGVGLALLKYLASIAVTENCGRLEWWVLDWNEPAIAFYKKLGAVPMDKWTTFRLGREEIKALAGEST